MCVISYSKKVAVSESRKIAWVAYLCQITNIGSVYRENYKRSDPGRAGILACRIARVKKVAVSKSREIVREEYLGHITNIGSGCA